MTRALVRALAPLALMGLIFFVSAQQADESLAWWEVVLRKTGHVGGYAVLTLLWTWTLVGVTARPVKIAVLIAFLYACTDEYHQSFVETRNGSAIDVGIDAIGIALTWLLIRWRSAASGPRTGTRSSPVRSP